MKTAKMIVLCFLSAVLSIPVATAAEKKAKPVDINSCTVGDLQKIDGLQGYAGKIVGCRPFGSVADLDGKVLPPALYLKVKNRLVVAKK